MGRFFNGGTDLGSFGSTSTFSYIQDSYNFAFSTWLKLTDHTALDEYGILDTCGGGSGQKGAAFWWDNTGGNHTLGFMAVFGTIGNYTYNLSVTGAITDDNWHHLLWTGESGAGTMARLFVDGTLLGSVAGSSHSVGNNSYAPVVGNFNAGGSTTALKGRLAEMAVWTDGFGLNAGDSATPLAYAKALAGGAPPWRIRPDLLDWYAPLWGLQSPEPDLSGNANAVTLTGTSQANHAPVTPFTRKARGEVEPTVGPTTGGLLLKRRRKLALGG